MSLKVGDSVIVLNGTLDPDFGFDIGGWQGRVHSIDAGDTVSIEWDSITLNRMASIIWLSARSTAWVGRR